MALLFGQSEAATALAALRQVPVETILLPVLVQLAVIILAARLFFVVFRRLGQPGVVGEIAAGLILGPSVLGALFPGAFRAIFHPTIEGVDPVALGVALHWIFTALAQVGLIFLLFLIGLEFDFSHLRRHGKSVLSISFAGVLAPFVLGVALAMLVFDVVQPTDANGAANELGFVLFMGTAMCITALPTLGRMMVELGIQRSRLGAITIASAACDDAVGWILLATIAAIVRGNFILADTLRMIALSVAFTALMILAVRPLMARSVSGSTARNQGDLALHGFALVLVYVLVCAMATSLIGIFAIFGAFLAGAVLSGQHEFREAIARRFQDFVTVFFLPIFFTYTGLRTEIDSLESLQVWLLCVAVTLVAVLGKFGGCGLAAWLAGLKPRDAACVGVMMNTRGLMELIVINVGYELGVIPRSVYCMLVVMAFVTTYMTTPILKRVARGTELEAPILASPLVSRGQGVSN